MNKVKYQFDKSFDGGLQDLTSRLKEQFDQDICQVQIDAEAKGFALGHQHALSELEVRNEVILATMESHIIEILQNMNSIHDRMLVQSAKAVQQICEMLTGIINDKLILEKLDSILAIVMPELMEAPRLVIRLPENLIETVRIRFDDILSQHGYSGKSIYISLQESINACPSIEWANGGLIIDDEDNMIKLREKFDEFITSIDIHQNSENNWIKI